MPVVFSLDEFDYILEEERELSPEAQGVFRLRPARYRDHEEITAIEYRAGPDGPIFLAEGHKTWRKILNRGLVGWKNVRDQSGNEVQFSRTDKAVDEKCLDLIEPWARELADAITERSRVTREQAKNS